MPPILKNENEVITVKPTTYGESIFSGLQKFSKKVYHRKDGMTETPYREIAPPPHLPSPMRERDFLDLLHLCLSVSICGFYPLSQNKSPRIPRLSYCAESQNLIYRVIRFNP